MRRLPILIATLATAAGAAPAADAATSIVLRGAGFGHGVGMSQFGTLGYAQHGWDYRRILGHYYSGTQIGKLVTPPTVSVLLQSGHGRYAVSGVVKAGTVTLHPQTTYTVLLKNDQVELRDGDKSLGSVDGTLRLSAAANGATALAGPAANGVSNGSYRGALDFTRSGSGLIAVNTLALESYVGGVISAEVSASWPAEALKTQAVAARTYAVTSNAGGAGGLFTQYADTRSQMYRGVSAETPATRTAVNATANEVVTYAGKPVTTYFFSTSGGRTENVENSFIGSDPKPWLKSVDDPYDTVSPVHRWGPLRFTRADAARRLAGFVRGRLRRISVVQRGVSPRIVRATVVGSAGTSAITGPQLRRAFGLRDAWIVFRSFTTGVVKKGPTGPTGPAGGGVGAPSHAAAGAARGPRLIVRGHITPARAGRWAVVERLQRGTWRRSVDVQLEARGRYETAVPGPGVYRLRYDGMVGPQVIAR